ncbi:MAG: c-type cytochrome [Dehalococcoidia bacterium]|nr:c-type cytochrome [Dehalococcoidia bacterium]
MTPPTPAPSRTHPATLRWVLLGALAVFALFLVACDDDDDPGGTATATQGTASPTPTEGDEDPDGTPTGPSGADAFTTPEPGEGPRSGGEIGQPASEDDIAAIDIDVVPGGAGLPEGSGTVAEGADVYATNCARCHGPSGTEGGIGPQIVGEEGPWEPGKTITIGSYWPYAETVYDYIRRAMPFDSPGSLTDDEVYAVVAWLLAEEGIIEEDAELNAETLPAVEMPNRNNFLPCWPDECRPDVP